MLEHYSNPATARTYAYLYCVNMGTVGVAGNAIAAHDRIRSFTAFREHNGILDYSLAELLSRCVDSRGDKIEEAEKAKKESVRRQKESKKSGQTLLPLAA